MLRVHEQAGVTRITLDRPEVRNALNDVLMDRLREALKAARERTRAVVLTGAGAVFSAGADLQWMERMRAASPAENLRDAERMADVFLDLYTFPAPVVALVNGPAVGGGLGLIAAADIAIASTEAWFAFTEVRLGLVPAIVAPYVIGRLGAHRSRNLFLRGERFDPAAALRWGLVDEVVPHAELGGALDRCLSALLAGAPGALSAAKELTQRVARESPAAIRTYTAQLIARRRADPEAREGFAAFFEKRLPRWQV